MVALCLYVDYIIGMTQLPNRPGIDSNQVFAAWAAMRSVIALRPLSADSIASYRSIWNGWCEFVATQNRSWNSANSNDVRGYIESLSASRTGKSNASPVTQKRYFRVLKEIYGCAVAGGWLDQNPVDHDALVSKSEQHDSLVFNRLDWAELYRHLPAVAELSDPKLPWQAVRDHSLLLTMMQAGLTVAELRDLSIDSVQHPRLVWTTQGAGVLSLPFMPWEAQSQSRMLLTVQGERNAQSRTLALHTPCETAMFAWLSLRLSMPCLQGPQSALYISQKIKSRLSPKSIFMVANHHILYSLRDRYGSDELAHAGPMTLRNSCIVRWLDAGLEDTDVLARAGLKDAQALRRLRQHVHRSADLAQIQATSPRRSDS